MKQKIHLTRSVDRAWDFYDSDLEALADPDLCQKLWDDIVSVGFTLVMPPQFYRFDGGGNGISFLAMLMESHVAIHTAPENRACLEITVHTCEISGGVVKKTPAKKTAELIALWKERFSPEKIVEFSDRVRADANW